MLAVMARVWPSISRGSGQHGQQPVGEPGDVSDVLGLGHQDRELVVPGAGDEVITGRELQPAGDAEQQPVADLPAEPVDDRVEPVEVERCRSRRGPHRRRANARSSHCSATARWGSRVSWSW